MSQGPNLLIQQLLDAEEEADRIVRKARENRAKKLKDAVQAAEDEIQLFRKKEESYKQQIEQKLSATDTATSGLEAETKKDIEVLQSNYEIHKSKATAFVLDMVTKVTLQCAQEKKGFATFK